MESDLRRAFALVSPSSTLALEGGVVAAYRRRGVHRSLDGGGVGGDAVAGGAVRGAAHVENGASGVEDGPVVRRHDVH